MIYKAFLNRQEITGFPVNGIETTEIYGGDTLLWRKKKEEIELDQWWDVYELYARFKDPTPYKRAEVGFAIRTAHGYLKGRMAFGFCTRVVNGKYMVTAAAVDDYLESGIYSTEASVLPACRYRQQIPDTTGRSDFLLIHREGRISSSGISGKNIVFTQKHHPSQFTHGAEHLKRNRSGLKTVTNRWEYLI